MPFFVRLKHYTLFAKQYFCLVGNNTFFRWQIYSLRGIQKPWFLNLKPQDTNFLTDADTPIQTSISAEKRDVDTPISNMYSDSILCDPKGCTSCPMVLVLIFAIIKTM
jgi:hypothetical protein